MKLITSPASSVEGILEKEIPGDKSISHRAALFAALASGTSRIERFQVSGVTRPMLSALTALGVEWHLDDETLTVKGKGISALKDPAAPLDCGNSATTMRLLAGAIAGANLTAVLDGSDGLRKRPMDRIVNPLRAMGIRITPSAKGTAPLQIYASDDPSERQVLRYDLPVASAQVKSCLLLAALGTKGTSTISEPGPSRDHTERMLSSMGVGIFSRSTEERIVVEITPPDPLVLQPLHMRLPSDPSAAAFLVVAALITKQSCLIIKGVCLNPTRTGLFEALHSMGADIKIENQHFAAGEPVGDLVVRSSVLRGTTINGNLVVRMIDEFPILAVAAALAQGVTTVRDAAELRLKESDRIAMLAMELRQLGVSIEEYPDGFSIHGGTLRGGKVQSHGDHRLAMSLTVAGLAADSPVTVDQAECTNESFPGFAETLLNLGTTLVKEV